MDENDQTPATNVTHSVRPFRGRFMDVVHPSSDVKIVDKANHASEKQVQQSVAIHPNDTSPEDFAKETSGAFEPIEFTQYIETPVDNTETEPADETAQEEPLEDVQLDDPENEPLKSPFLTGVKVDKRPLGSTEEPETTMPDWLQRGLGELNNLELPADDGGSGELELALPTEEKETFPESQEEHNSNDLELDASTTPLSESTVQPPRDVRAALENTMIHPQYESTNVASVAGPASQYVYADHAEAVTPTKVKKHVPAWTWITIYVLLILVGGAIGVFVYLSGWLS